jgi:hypothetical protein
MNSMSSSSSKHGIEGKQRKEPRKSKKVQEEKSINANIWLSESMKLKSNHLKLIIALITATNANFANLSNVSNAI